MKSKKLLGYKMKANDGRMLMVAFDEERKEWYICGRRAHKKSHAIKFTQQSMDMIVDLYQELRSHETINYQLDRSSPTLEWKELRPKGGNK